MVVHFMWLCVSCDCVFHVVVCVFRVFVCFMWLCVCFLWLCVSCGCVCVSCGGGVGGQVKRSCWPAAQYDVE